ncbi:hypothetical protein A8D91_18165 [Burkholderia cenocepacia]|nr:hypothetical protein A8D83_00005 [Burkholderia cenocepacia]ONP28601.1 hypothetical protein A8D85_35235 [Burkholderia cenocepacia]ONP51957.1 hypothetical protein A8D89_31640 [Burkholderia cenocepacia]ONP80109.1 hypothetical protein A8D91_18165 [Burkholderia cenocepacia]ONP80302.1 hypothetical protein A8D92_30830 [Burkholderia cenocepacia]
MVNKVSFVRNQFNELRNTHLLDGFFCSLGNSLTSFDSFFNFLTILVLKLDGGILANFGISTTGELFRIILLDFFIRISTSRNNFSDGVNLTIQERKVFCLISLGDFFTNRVFQFKKVLFFIGCCFKIRRFCLKLLKFGEFFFGQNFLGIIKKRHFSFLQVWLNSANPVS